MVAPSSRDAWQAERGVLVILSCCMEFDGDVLALDSAECSVRR
jgi:hypothetical protein